MAKKRLMHIKFPLGGLDRELAHQKQAPFTTIDCLNVRAIGMLEERERGGSRPGIARSHIEDLGGEVRLLSPMTLALGDGFTAWSDTFSGESMAANWTKADWAAAIPSILPDNLAGIDTSVEDAAAVMDVIPTLDTDSVYTVEMYLAPWGGAWHGTYTLYLRLDDSAPDITDEGVEITLTMTGTDGAYVAVMTSYLSGLDTEIDTATGTLDSTKAGYLSATVDGDDVSVFWGEAEIMSGTVDVQTGTRNGFGLTCTVEGNACTIHVFRVQHYSTVLSQGLRSMLIASADGNLFREGFYGSMGDPLTTDLSLRDDIILTAAQSGQELVIADFGDLSYTGTDADVAGTALTADGAPDWTALTTPPDPDDMVAVITNPQGSAVAGTYTIASVSGATVTLDSSAGTGACAVRIERAPKVYSPADDTLTILEATAGQVPTGCPLCTRFMDRMVFAGAEIAPHVYYMSRKGGYVDYDYSQADSRRAIAGGTGDEGVPGEGITAMVAHSDDFLIFGCRNQMWRQRGDPGYGGDMDAISYKVGIVGPKAWCIGPSGELIFLSVNGLYVLQPGGQGYPFPISEGRLPREFQNFDPKVYTASMEFDTHDNGVHVFLSAEAGNATTHWWFDWKNKTYWPVSVTIGLDPMATCSYEAIAIEESGIIMGGRDGRLRRFSNITGLDDGTAFESYAVIGPINLAPDGTLGKIVQLDCTMAESSGDVTWTIATSLTAEGTQTSTYTSTGTFVAGLNYTVRPASRGGAFTLKLEGTAGRRWALEGITSVVSTAGIRRMS